MTIYLQAFYQATNGYCTTMTSTMYTNEILGENTVSQNNKLTGKDGFRYHLPNVYGCSAKSHHHSVFSKYNSKYMNVTEVKSWLKTHLGIVVPPSWSSQSVVALFNGEITAGFINSTNCSFLNHNSTVNVTSATLSEMIAGEASWANKPGLPSTQKPAIMQLWATTLAQANTEFSNIKNQAQAGTSQINGWVQTDGDELAAAANLLAGVLQSLANPFTVS